MNGAGSPGNATFARTAEPVRATVLAGGVETEYHRCGSGSPVVLLLMDSGDPDRDRTMRVLSSRARVIAPRIPAAVDFSSWLRDFLDGVGVEPVHIVATTAFEVPAREFAASDPTRIEQLSTLAPTAAPASRE